MSHAHVSHESSAARADLAALIDPWLQHMRWRADYDSWREKRLTSEQHQAESLALVTHVAGSLAGTRILDLGCGMGGFAVAAELAGAQVTALDYNQAYCVITGVRGDQYDLDLPVVRAAGEALPLPDSHYDVVTAWDVLEHVQRPEHLVAEIGRVLKPGGHVLMTAINRFALRDPHYHLPLINWLPRPIAEVVIDALGRSKRRAAFRDRQRLSEMHYYTWRALRRLTAQYGLTAIDLDEERVRRGEVAPNRAQRRAVLHTLDRLGLTLPLYRLYRALVQGTYRIALRKDAAL